ncbi:MAG: nucleotidyltransferase family protein [Hormoscilla sp. GM7CHS1pb]|nr:nucleotidyltransferase family protein [Hormoscilla sp. GM7CHS1pb]
MRRAELLELLREYRLKLQQYGVKSLAVFGSVARDEATPTSDVDLLVEFDGVVTFDRYMDLKFLLEDGLGRSVDLVSAKMLKPQIRETVLQEAIDVS